MLCHGYAQSPDLFGNEELGLLRRYVLKVGGYDRLPMKS